MDSIVTFKLFLVTIAVLLIQFLVVLTDALQQVLHLVNTKFLDVMHIETCVLDKTCNQISPMSLFSRFNGLFFLN